MVETLQPQKELEQFKESLEKLGFRHVEDDETASQQAEQIMRDWVLGQRGSNLIIHFIMDKYYCSSVGEGLECDSRLRVGGFEIDVSRFRFKPSPGPYYYILYSPFLGKDSCPFNRQLLIRISPLRRVEVRTVFSSKPDDTTIYSLGFFDFSLGLPANMIDFGKRYGFSDKKSSIVYDLKTGKLCFLAVPLGGEFLTPIIDRGLVDTRYLEILEKLGLKPVVDWNDPRGWLAPIIGMESLSPDPVLPAQLSHPQREAIIRITSINHPVDIVSLLINSPSVGRELIELRNAIKTWEIERSFFLEKSK